MLDQFILYFHVFFMAATAFYAFLFKKNLFDYVFLFVTYSIILSWTFSNGECLISYFFKKIRNKNYILGECVDSEFKIVFKNHVRLVGLLCVCQNILLMTSIVLVCMRNKISAYLYIPFIIVFEILLYGINSFETRINNKNFEIFNSVSKTVVLLLGLIYLWFFNKRFHVIKYFK